MSYVDKVKIGDGPRVRFRARWRDPSGRQKAKSFDTRKQALDFLTKIDAAKLVGSYVDPAHGKVLIADQARVWLAGRDVRPSTLARDDSYFRSMILPHFGEVPIGQVRAADVAAWKMELLGSKSPATVSKALTLFKSMLNDAVRDGLIPANPIAGVKLPSIEREERRFLAPEELLRLAEAIDPRYPCPCLCGWLRWSEDWGTGRTSHKPDRHASRRDRHC